MRTGKRTLAGVAAGALVAGMVPFAVVAAASSANAATVTGSVSPVRWSDTATTGTKDTVTYSTLSWTSSAALAGSDTVDVEFTNGPAGSAMCASATDLIATNSCQGDSGTDYASIALFGEEPVDLGGTSVATGGTATIGISASKAGTYTGVATSYASGVAKDTVTFTFSTVGAAASYSVAPASQTVSVGASADIAVSVVTSAGVPTQMSNTERIQVTTTAGTLTPTDGLLEYTDITAVSNEFSITSASTATATLTASPLGAWPSAAAQTATVTWSGAISTTAIGNIVVASPSNAINAGTQPSAATATVPSGSSSITVQITGAAGNAAGDVIRLKAVSNAGTPTGAYENVTLDASKKGTATFTLGGLALVDSAQLTVTQVNSANSAVGGVQLVVTQADRDISTSTISATPSGANVRKIGDTTNVTVTVLDQFDDPVSSAIVGAYRATTVTGSPISAGTTDANGEASVPVTNASGIVSGTTENYSYQVQAVGKTTTAINNDLQIQYTTTGAISSVSVAVSVGTSPVTNTTTSIATLPYVLVPYDGTVNSAASGTYTVSTGAGTAGGEYVTFTPTTSPANSVDVTVPTGVKVATSLTSLIWSGGSQTATVTSGSPVYVFATKTGTHDVTFTSGGVTSTAKIQVATAPAASYNIAVSPASQTIQSGSFSTVTVTVTDVFGNPVPAATGAGTGGVTLSATGEVLFGGLSNTTNVTTGADGTAAVSIVAGNAGSGSITAGPQGGSSTTTPAWVAGYTPPTGAPSPVTSAAAEITVTPSSTKSITITGERGTVSGKPGIMVDGLTVGFAEGDLMVPHIKFPGQTSYSEGSARPAVDADGEFYWQRKTGKKIYVYFTNEDGSVKSDRIIIQAK